MLIKFSQIQVSLNSGICKKSQIDVGSNTVFIDIPADSGA